LLLNAGMKRKVRRRFCTALLAVSLVISMLPPALVAAEPGQVAGISGDLTGDGAIQGGSTDDPGAGNSDDNTDGGIGGEPAAEETPDAGGENTEETPDGAAASEDAVLAKIMADGTFSEDFDDQNAEGWTTYQGTWSAADGSYRVNKGSGFKAVADETDFANFTYEADIVLKDGASADNAGIIFRVSDPSNGADNLKGYYAGLGVNNRVTLGRMNNNWKELISVSYPVEQNRTYRLKVTALGNEIEIYVDGVLVVSGVDNMFTRGSIGVRSHWINAAYDNISVTDAGDVSLPAYDWSWVQGAVFVPTNAVNQIQQWDEYDHAINERELSYAKLYGINLVRVFVHNLLWEDDSTKLLANLEDFLGLADRYGIKVELVFFDDCWNDYPEMGPQLPPRYGAHNSRWVEGPGDAVKADYAANKQKLKEYVQGIVNAHKDDPRIAFWNIYNEPSNGESGLMDQVTRQIMNDARIWIRDTGSKLPISSTGGQFSGEPTSDFITWHPYEANYPAPYGYTGQVLADEVMNRSTQSVSGVVENFGRKGIGFVMWELGIGRDNTRFPWGSDVNPLTSEPAIPFHGVVYPDGHPYDIADIRALTGDRFDTLPVFNVKYYSDSDFASLVKTSISPRIDFDLGDEKGTGSPDASAGIGEDGFSIRWDGTIRAEEEGEYTFYADSDNIARIWIDGTKVVDKSSGGREEITGQLELEAGREYAVRVEYAHAAGDASLHVYWSSPVLAKTVLLPVYSGTGIENVELDTGDFTLKAGGSRQLQPVLTPANASVPQLIWTSSRSGVAAVDANGIVTAMNKGKAVITVSAGSEGPSASVEVTVDAGTTFRNPIVPVSGSAGSADPSVVFKDGYYYYVKSENDASLAVARTKRLQDIGTTPRVTVYTPPAGQMYSKGLWAPELQYLKGKWYIYFAADNGNNDNHRMYVLESKTQDAQGEYIFKGKISDPSDRWAIDGAVLETADGPLYFVWSGWEGTANVKQDLYIAPMSDPWTISGPRVRISTPDQSWERIGTPYINEAPEVLQRGGKIFIVYSASGSWTDDYTLGMLTNSGGDVLDPASWVKSGPVFSKAPTAYGPGHHSFTASPDGTEDWIVYHADLRSGGSWGNRSVRAQAFGWKADGTPDFGTPATYGMPIEQPSGTQDAQRLVYEAEHALLGGAVKVKAAADASGGKVAGFIDTAGNDYVEFEVDAARAGDYSLIAMAANGSGGLAQHDVAVNGGESRSMDYRDFGWDHYNPSSVTVTLKEGANTIRFTAKTLFAELDVIILEPVDSGGAVDVESLTLDKPTLTVTAGASGTLTASVRPIQGTDKNVVVTSSDPEVATAHVNRTDAATGSVALTVQGLKPGSAVIRVASAADGAIYAECTVTVRGLPAEPSLEGYTVDHFDETGLATGWTIFQESAENWNLTQNPGALTIRTTATDVYQNNNSQNNVFLRLPGTEDFEIVTKLTAPIAKNHQQAGLFVWQNADNFVKLAHVWDNGRTIETAYELNQVYRKPAGGAAHPGTDTITLKIKKAGNVYTTYYWDGYAWIQASEPLTASLSNIKVGLFANNIVATNDRIDVKFDYFAVKAITAGVDLTPKKLTLPVGATAQLANDGGSGSEVVWTSSNADIVSVNAAGLAEAKKPGRAVITATALEGGYSGSAVVDVPETQAPPAVLYAQDFAGGSAADWKTYGGEWSTAGEEYSVNSGAGFKAVYEGGEFTDFIYEADVKLTAGTEAGLIFRASEPAVGPDAYEGYYVGINAAAQSAVLGKAAAGKWTELASKKMKIGLGVPVHLKVIVNRDHLQIFINDNPLNVNGYPKFDLTDDTHIATGSIGVRTWNAAASFDNISVKPAGTAGLPSGNSYTNSVLDGVADPFVLFHKGTYYLYGTNTVDYPNMPNGIKVYTSKDLVHWTAHEGWALDNKDSWGENRFWAPEVVEKNGTFYMYYAVEEHLAVATSDSPLGPFIQEVQQPLHADIKEIDAHIFTDDDGKQYMYFVRFNNNNEMWVAELNDDMMGIKEDTLQFVFRATQDWEKSQKAPVASINEGPFVIKHKGLYYLTYSGNHFQSPDYGVGYAVSESPTGPWTKYEYNPIMKSNTVVPGAGHHSLIASPDGKELFMVYHTHFSQSSTEPRKLAIDRVQFVPQENGIDAMEVWGPTVTPQLMPSAQEEEGPGTNPGTDPGTDPGTSPGTGQGTNPGGTGSPGGNTDAGLSPIEEKDGIAVVTLDETVSTARVALDSVAGRTLEVTAESVVLSLTPELLSGWATSGGDMAGATLEVSMQPASGSAGAMSTPGVSFKTAGQVYDVRVTLRTKERAISITGDLQAGMTLTFAYDPSSVAGELLGVYYLNETTGEWEYTGGSVNTDTHKVAVELKRLGRYGLLEYSKTYADVPSGHWAYRTLKVLSAKHIVNGTAENRFLPGATTTRAEFAAMLARSLGLAGNSVAVPFRDVAEDAWFRDAVAAAYAAGLVQGTSGQTFSPNEIITREQMAIMLVRAYEYGGARIAAGDELGAYNDGTKISTWAAGDVNKAIAAGLMQGTGQGLFNGEARAVRAETAQAVLNLLERRN